jgi:hypothetical protein
VSLASRGIPAAGDRRPCEGQRDTIRTRCLSSTRGVAASYEKLWEERDRDFVTAGELVLGDPDLLNDPVADLEYGTATSTANPSASHAPRPTRLQIVSLAIASTTAHTAGANSDVGASRP